MIQSRGGGGGGGGGKTNSWPFFRYLPECSLLGRSVVPGGIDYGVHFLF